jgi:hypothetical protein
MPINYTIDREHRVVIATAHGALTAEDIFGYQKSVWSQPDVAGFDELVDMTRVHHIVEPSAERIQDLAKLSAGMDAPAKSRFAIVAPDDLAFGLGRMFASFRRIEEASTKSVGVFRTLDQALAFLGIDQPSASAGS